MSSSTSDLRNSVMKAYDDASIAIQNLEDANKIRESEVRQSAIDKLSSYQSEIEVARFFEIEDKQLGDLHELMGIANSISEIISCISEGHEITLMELESDLANFVQELSLGSFQWVLNTAWASEQRSFVAGYRHVAPRGLPEEVQDEFQVELFTRCQWYLNFKSKVVGEVKLFGCLNREDYNSVEFRVSALGISSEAAHASIGNFFDRQANREDLESIRRSAPTIGGVVWSVIGWDSPGDFIKDLIIFSATGGAGKLIRWGRALKKTQRRISRSQKALDLMLNLERRIKDMEKRVDQIRSAAERIRKLKRFVEIPNKIMLAFKNLGKAEEHLKILKQVKDNVTKTHVRGIATTVAARMAADKDVKFGGAVTNELAYKSVVALVDGLPLGKKLNAMRGDINLAFLLLDRWDGNGRDKFLSYFYLLWIREFLIRYTLATIRSEKISQEKFINEFIASFGAALDSTLVDMPVLTEVRSREIVKGIVNFVRKYLVELGKELAEHLV